MTMNGVEIFGLDHLYQHFVWLVLAFGAMVVSMAADFITGVHKAKLAGNATTSTGFKKTCDKAMKYFLPYLCTVCVDLIASVILPAPFFSLVYAAFCCLCEWKSVFENTHKKEEMRQAANTMKVVVDNKDDIVKMIAEAMEKMCYEKSEEKNSNDK